MLVLFFKVMVSLLSLNTMGYIGTVLLALCSVPQLLTTFRKKTVEGLSLSMLITCFLGCVCMLVFVIGKQVTAFLAINYLFNAISYLVLSIGYLKYRKRPNG